MIFTIEYYAKLAFVENTDHHRIVECDHRNNEVHMSANEDMPVSCGIFEMHDGSVNELYVNETGKAMIFGGIVEQLKCDGECVIALTHPGSIQSIHAGDRARITISRHALMQLRKEGCKFQLDEGAIVMFEGTVYKLRASTDPDGFVQYLLEETNGKRFAPNVSRSTNAPKID